MTIYYYVNRWFDEFDVPHYHGVYSESPTLALAQKTVQFNVLDVPVDLVYQAEDEADMFAYLDDVNRNIDNDENLGSMDWL